MYVVYMTVISVVAVVLKKNQFVRHLVISMCKNLDRTVISVVADCLGRNLV